MALVPVHIERFGGINLRDDPAEVGLNQAIDLLNVDLDRQGVVRSRPGLSAVSTFTTTTQPRELFYWDENSQFLIDTGSTVYARTSSGGAVASSAVGGRGFVPVGTASAAYVYFPIGPSDVITRWDGSAFSAPAGLSSYTPKALTVQQPDNRLVMAGLATAQASRVQFSDAGAPETVTANNYVDLAPNDGERIFGAGSWGQFVFVAKRTKLFIFYGNSTDSSGNPVFNYRVERLPTYYDANTADPRRMVAGDRGMYILTMEGLYRSTGGPVTKVSGPLDLIWGSTVPTSAAPFWSGDRITGVSSRLMAAHGRLFVSTASGTYVYDEDRDFWTYWATNAAGYFGVTPFMDTTNDRTAVLYKHATSDYRIAYFTPDLGTSADSGIAITSYYRSGFGDFGYPGQEKTIREAELTGQGTVQLGYSRDFGSITTTSQANVTMGTAPAVDRGYHRKSQDGELLGWQINSVNGGAWQLNRLTAMLRDVRAPAENTG